jgi:hypothetical protein
MHSFPITSVGYLGQAPMSLWGLLGVWVIGTGKCHWPFQAALSGSIIKAPGFAGGYLHILHNTQICLSSKGLDFSFNRSFTNSCIQKKVIDVLIGVNARTKPKEASPLAMAAAKKPKTGKKKTKTKTKTKE